MKVLLISPPLVQINTAYPATSFLAGYLKTLGPDLVSDVMQMDLGLELVLKLFSQQGIRDIRAQIQESKNHLSVSTQFFLDAYSDYERTIEDAIQFLQGKNPSLAHRLAARMLLPEGPRFAQNLGEDAEESLRFGFGSLGVQDQAKHIASLYLDDLVDVIQECVDPYFSLSRYAEKLSASRSSYDEIHHVLEKGKNTLIDSYLEELLLEKLKSFQPQLVGISVPFPGSFLGGVKAAKIIKNWSAATKVSTKVIMGGGYINTELRSLSDARAFRYVDAMTYDDGEKPFECLLEYYSGKRERTELLRTRMLSEKVSGAVEWISSANEHDVPQLKTGIPTLSGLPIGRYVSMVEMLNPMHRLWSDLFWNKIMLAHGCYWHQCSFCDITLDYIQRYEVSPVEVTIQRMKALVKESGSTGFHFVDEAAPPAVLKELSQKLIDEKLNYSWWGNIRFEKTFTPQLCDLMADAGCIAVSGGLEVASDRLLKLMKKGVTVEQVARVTKAFRNSKVKVHAYLMYGFPTQTAQETIDSLERVRQLFEEGCIDSAFWHRFSATAHSAMGRDPEKFNIQLERPAVTFGENDLEFSEVMVEGQAPIDHGDFSLGLKKAVYNYMHGVGIDFDVREWFEFKVPKTTVSSDFVRKALLES